MQNSNARENHIFEPYQETTLTTFRLNIVFSGIDFDDDEVFERLGALPNIYWRSQGLLTFATAIVDSDSAVAASLFIAQKVRELVPSSSPLRLDEDLVSIPDIAGRIGVTREAVRNWANGARHSNFPIPKGIVGGTHKIWAWSSVSSWLNENLNLGDKEEFPTESETAQVNASFQHPRKQFETLIARRTIATTTSSPPLKSPVEPERHAVWIEASNEESTFLLVPIDLGINVAA